MLRAPGGDSSLRPAPLDPSAAPALLAVVALGLMNPRIGQPSVLRQRSELVMAQESADVELLSLAGDLGRDVAPQCLLTPGDGSAELVILASQVQRVDVVAGTATRLRIERHLREHSSGLVTFMPPATPTPAEHYLELLMPLPDGVKVTTQLDLRDRPRFALVPATPIADEGAAVDAASFALEACEAARIADTRANLVAAAIAELSANALQHGIDMSDSPVVAMTVSGRVRTLEVAVTDPGRGISEAVAPVELVRAIPGAKAGNGFLADLVRRGRKRDLDVSIEVLAGNARLRWTWASHRTEERVYVPGTTVVVRVPA